MMLAWQGNPRQEFIERRRSQTACSSLISTMIRYLVMTALNGFSRCAPFLFGGIWEFGGRTTLGANVQNITAAVATVWEDSNGNMVGTAVCYRGCGYEPVCLRSIHRDGVAKRGCGHLRSGPRITCAVATEPPILMRWRRGRLLLNTAYGIRIDAVKFNSERDAAQESLFDAQPRSQPLIRASNWSPEAIRYDAEAIQTRCCPKCCE
jgi:alpha-N-acetylglucosaminidase